MSAPPKPPTPEQCDAAATALRRAAAVERAGGDDARARQLDQAAEIMEAKAFVGALETVLRRTTERVSTRAAASARVAQLREAGYKVQAADLGDHIAIHIHAGKHADLSRLPATPGRAT